MHVAVIHFCKSLAVEWKNFARVNTVSPGFFDTGMGAGPTVLKTAFEMAALGRQGDVKELKGVRAPFDSNRMVINEHAECLRRFTFTSRAMRQRSRLAPVSSFAAHPRRAPSP
jgi:NAD(P)-dependent dehydrogenase (short-subunit alcohol dehydrogenase family)